MTPGFELRWIDFYGIVNAVIDPTPGMVPRRWLVSSALCAAFSLRRVRRRFS